MASSNEHLLLSRLSAGERSYVEALRVCIEQTLSRAACAGGTDVPLPLATGEGNAELLARLYAEEGWSVSIGRSSGLVLRFRRA